MALISQKHYGSVHKKQTVQHLFENASIEQGFASPCLRNGNLMHMTHPQERFLSSVVLARAGYDDTRLVQASQQGTRMPLLSSCKDTSTAPSLPVCAYCKTTKRLVRSPRRRFNSMARAVIIPWRGVLSDLAVSCCLLWLFATA